MGRDSMRRVAVTGIGALCASGRDAASTWRAVRDGAVAIRIHEGLAGPGDARGPAWPQARVPGLDADEVESRFGREAPMLDRATAMALIASDEAVAMAIGQRRADAAGLDPARAGAVFGAAVGHGTLEEAYGTFFGGTPRSRGAGLPASTTAASGAESTPARPPLPPRLHPFAVPRGMPSAAASRVSMRHGLAGPTLATASACASSAHAIGLAFHFVRHGLLDFAVAGGTDAPLVPGMVRAWEGLRALSPDACRPFSRDRSGLVLGEGAAALVLEPLEQARARGAPVLAEVLGFGMSADAGDITAPDPDGAARAMRAALADAALPPAAVDHVNAHGTGTRLNDPAEVRALRTVFGARLDAIPVSASKSQFGHALNAAGALEALVTVMSLRDGFVPPTMGFDAPDPDCAIDCVPLEGRAQPIAVAMSNSFGFGGLNAVLLFGRG